MKLFVNMLFSLVFLNENARDDTVEPLVSDYTKCGQHGKWSLTRIKLQEWLFWEGVLKHLLNYFIACDMRNSMFSLKVFCILLVAQHMLRTWVENGRLQGLKLTMENYKTVTPNCGRRRLLDVVVYNRFQLQSSDWKFFFWWVVAYERWLHMEVQLYVICNSRFTFDL